MSTPSHNPHKIRREGNALQPIGQYIAMEHEDIETNELDFEAIVERLHNGRLTELDLEVMDKIRRNDKSPRINWNTKEDFDRYGRKIKSG